MLQLIIIIAIVLIFLALRHIRRQTPKDRPKYILRYTLYGLVIIAVSLVISGRLHWIAAMITASLPVFQRLLPFLMKLIPFYQLKQRQTEKPNENMVMDENEALQILGLATHATQDEIVQRHRQLIQKNHPDRGGSDYLAAKINKAKDILLARANK